MPGPRYAYFYKWANVIAITQFEKYKKRGYDVLVRAFAVYTSFPAFFCLIDGARSVSSEASAACVCRRVFVLLLFLVERGRRFFVEEAFRLAPSILKARCSSSQEPSQRRRAFLDGLKCDVGTTPMSSSWTLVHRVGEDSCYRTFTRTSFEPASLLLLGFPNMNEVFPQSRRYVPGTLASCVRCCGLPLGGGAWF